MRTQGAPPPSSLRFRLLLIVLLAVIPAIALALSAKPLPAALGLVAALGLAGAAYGADRSVRRLHADLERRLLDHDTRLREADAALDSFTYSVSHDMRAPLRAMQGLAHALVEDYADRLDDTGKDYARRIIASAERMDGLMLDLLAYSRISRADVDLAPIGLDAVVADSLRHLQRDAPSPTARIDVRRPLPVAMAHRPTLAQVVENLLSNAVKFVAPGVQPRVTVWAEQRDDRIRLCVGDNGIGIDPQHHERIFRALERLHGIEAYPGTGMGLAIVRKGMERMQGRAGVESEPGRGSRFWIELKRGEDRGTADGGSAGEGLAGPPGEVPTATGTR